MDVFALRERVVGEYRDYFESFVNILDERIEGFVRERLDDGELWPDAVLQLNPAYAEGPTLDDLARRGVIARETARFFGSGLRLHRHQEEALALAQRSQPYIVSTGTGSGKSLTYLLPIVDHVFRHEPGRHSVRAIVVYPMNALVNSQLEALRRYRDRNWPDCPVRFDRYTGQEKNEARQAILDDPPHLLLTNYVMLEYMLIRPHERALVQQATRALQYLVLDELHVYRGRQGADVAMLLRRLRQRTANANLRFVGTSATLTTEGSRRERRARIAELGATLFGVPVAAEQVVDETLRRVSTVPAPADREALRAAVLAEPSAQTVAAVTGHPLATWVEETFGLDREDGRLVRRSPITFRDGLRVLVERTGLDEAVCRDRLQGVLAAGNAALLPSGEPVFAFRLHQFLGSGSSVYATLQPPAACYLTTKGQFVAPVAEEAGGGQRLLFPLAFCRDCGQEYYLVAAQQEGGGQLDEGGESLDNRLTSHLLPRSPLLNAPNEDTAGTPGFFAVGGDDLWSEQEELPEYWQEERATGTRVKPAYAPHVPKRLWVRPDGTYREETFAGAIAGWFQPRPLMLCLRCRAAYDLREKSDFGKLATLSQIGRSTATTITVAGAVAGLGEGHVEAAAQKVLSFTDNRQDASLQAGHLNDFTQVTLLRGALVQAMGNRGSLTADVLGAAVFEALAPEPADFMREPVESGPGHQHAVRTMQALLEYRALEDLRRGWRVAQPNLEQCGLLRVEYEGLAELAGDDARWAAAPAMASVTPERRAVVLRAVLDYLRGMLAIDAPCLQPDQADRLKRQALEWLRPPWAMDEFERLRWASLALLPGAEPPKQNKLMTFGLGWRSTLGRYLRSPHTWGADERMPTEAVDDLVRVIVEALRGHLLTVLIHLGEPYGVQLKPGALRWTPGDGAAAGPDPVRSRSLHLRKANAEGRAPNRYFSRLYREGAGQFRRLVGREHTGQVAMDDRIERERDFRAGTLKALFCSPTMELGVDIADLAVVHMRNVPPTPANYAQRSGRAGRGGRPALVLAFCSQGNAHDEYFFRRRVAMIAGAVAPARLDLANRELVEAHLHSVWLAAVGLRLGQSLADVLDLDDPAYPLLPDVAAQLALSDGRQLGVVAAFRDVVEGAAIAEAEWFGDEWLARTVREAPAAFDRALDRWRELYKAAVERRDAAFRQSNKPRLSRAERESAERQEQEAKREIALLLNQGEITESDFYPYRYLANEGFLPGYNFPRLPLRVLVATPDAVQAIDRPRFLGLTEFGPQNVIYHEGRKHRVAGSVLPPGGVEERLTQAKLCLMCGSVHPGEAASVDVCAFCGTRLDGATAEQPQRLFDQPVARSVRWSRISSDEEERVREGYDVTTHFRLPAAASLHRMQAQAAGQTIMELTLAPHTELWRINNGWRRSKAGRGFTLDAETGLWRKQPEGENDADDVAELPSKRPIAGVRPYVTDHRNVLLLRPSVPSADPEGFLRTLVYALQRGIQTAYQLEEHEVAVELVGREAHRRLLMWEAAEGGTGVWERLRGDSHAIGTVAKEALRLCHFDPETGEEQAGWSARCAVACYDCLLSYGNQREHRFLDRHLIRDYMLALARSKLVGRTAERDYDEQYRWLLERTDPSSELERRFLAFLHERRWRLPDHAQHRPADDVPAQPDFYYERDGLPGVCVFVDGPLHDANRQHQRDQSARDALEDRGFRVLSVRYDRPFDEQVADHADVFGGL